MKASWARACLYWNRRLSWSPDPQSGPASPKPTAAGSSACPALHVKGGRLQERDGRAGFSSRAIWPPMRPRRPLSICDDGENRQFCLKGRAYVLVNLGVLGQGRSIHDTKAFRLDRQMSARRFSQERSNMVPVVLAIYIPWIEVHATQAFGRCCMRDKTLEEAPDLVETKQRSICPAFLYSNRTSRGRSVVSNRSKRPCLYVRCGHLLISPKNPEQITSVRRYLLWNMRTLKSSKAGSGKSGLNCKKSSHLLPFQAAPSVSKTVSRCAGMAYDGSRVTVQRCQRGVSSFEFGDLPPEMVQFRPSPPFSTSLRSKELGRAEWPLAVKVSVNWGVNKQPAHNSAQLR